MLNLSEPINELKKILKPSKYKKIFILTGKNSFYLSGIDKILKKSLTNQECCFFFKKSKIPEVKELTNIIKKLNKFNPDLVLAIGGGSVLDYAKIANNIRDLENLKKNIIYSNYKIKKKYPVLAIPTTAGSGAEVTPNAVIYIGKIKYSIEDNLLVPDFFLIIPEIVMGLKKTIKASSGFDAIAQGIESLISKKSNDKSVNFATKSLKISLENYIDFIKKPNIGNTYKMCLAANFSGKAISISRTTAPHALSYPFTSHYGINHGHAVSLTLNEFLKFNYENIKYADCKFSLKERYNILFKLTKASNINELNLFIKSLKKKANLETNFKKLKINANNSMLKILSGVNLQRLVNNPIKINISDLKIILKGKYNEN